MDTTNYTTEHRKGQHLLSEERHEIEVFLKLVEYTWLMLPSAVIGICLDISVMQAHPEQITYVIYAFYSLICVTIGFFRVRRLYAEQRNQMKNETLERSIPK